jgi:cyclic pyranopterin phosphate synthase
MNKMTHLNSDGEANMVDISLKKDTSRSALAISQVILSETILRAINDGNVPKGDLFASAMIAGIQAAKKCSELIPLCHPIPLTKATIRFEISENRLSIYALCKTSGRTGVEMEALTAASIAALTIYDMCKGIDKDIVIKDTRLLEKIGGKSGHWISDKSGGKSID